VYWQILADIAAGQWGLVTAAQARAGGVSAQTLARLARQGTLERLLHGVYRLAGVSPEQQTDLRAAWLSLDPTRTAGQRLTEDTPAAVSHASAAAIHGLGDLAGDVYEFTLPGRRQTRHPDVKLHRAQLQARDWQLVDGLPTTTPTRTIGDLAAGRLDGGHLAGVVRDAVIIGLADVDELAEALAPFAHHYGAPLGDGRLLLSRLVEQAGVPTRSQKAGELVTATVQGADRAADWQRPLRELLTSPVFKAAVREAAAVRESAAFVEALRPALDAASGQRQQLWRSTVEAVNASQREALRPAVEAITKANASQMQLAVAAAAQQVATALQAGRVGGSADAVAAPDPTSAPAAVADGA